MNKINLKTKFVASVLLLLLLLPSLVLAQQPNLNTTLTPQEQATFDQILQPVMKIYNLVKYIATAIAALVLLLAGVNYMMSGADPKKRDNAKGMAMYVVIGLVIIWAAPLVVSFIVS